MLIALAAAKIVTAKLVAIHAAHGLVAAEKAAELLAVHGVHVATPLLAKAGAFELQTGGAIHHSAAALVPVKFAVGMEMAAVFVEGIIIGRHSDEFLEEIDLRVIKRWFGSDPARVQGTPFTATGTMADGQFRVEPPTGAGPFAMLQGVVDADSPNVSQARVITGIQSMSRTVVSNHRGSGIALYLPSQYANA